MSQAIKERNPQARTLLKSAEWPSRKQALLLSVDELQSRGGSAELCSRLEKASEAALSVLSKLPKTSDIDLGNRGFESQAYLARALKAGHLVHRQDALTGQPLVLGKGPLGEIRGFCQGYWLSPQDLSSLCSMTEQAARIWLRDKGAEDAIEHMLGFYVPNEGLEVYSLMGALYLPLFEDESLYMELSQWTQLYDMPYYRQAQCRELLSQGKFTLAIAQAWANKKILRVFTSKPESYPAMARARRFYRPKSSPRIDKPADKMDAIVHRLAKERIAQFGFKPLKRPQVSTISLQPASEAEYQRVLEEKLAEGYEVLLSDPKTGRAQLIHLPKQARLYACRNHWMTVSEVAQAFGVSIRCVYNWRNRVSEEEFEKQILGVWLGTDEVPVFSRNHQIWVGLLHDPSKFLPFYQWCLVYGITRLYQSKATRDYLTGVGSLSNWPYGYLAQALEESQGENYFLQPYQEGEILPSGFYAADNKQGTLAAWSLVLQKPIYDTNKALLKGNVGKPSPKRGRPTSMDVKRAQALGLDKNNKCGTEKGVEKCLGKAQGEVSKMCAACQGLLMKNLTPRIIKEGVEPYLFTWRPNKSERRCHMVKTPEGLKTLKAATAHYGQKYPMVVLAATNDKYETFEEFDAHLSLAPRTRERNTALYRALESSTGAELELILFSRGTAVEAVHQSLAGRVRMCCKTLYIQDTDGQWLKSAQLIEKHGLDIKVSAFIKRLRGGLDYQTLLSSRRLG